jgi:hypothetical protein
VLANTGAEADPDLDLTEALNWSRAQIAAHQQEYAKLSEQCKLWERRVLAKEKPPQFVVTLPNEKLIWEGQRVELMAKIEVTYLRQFEGNMYFSATLLNTRGLILSKKK